MYGDQDIQFTCTEICHFVPNTFNIWSIIIQSVFIDNHPTSTFNPQTLNKLNSKHLSICVDY